MFAVALSIGSSAVGQDRFRPGGGGGSAAANNPATGMIASVEFVDTPTTAIFRMISDLTGWSIVTSPEVTKSPPRINIWVKNLTAEQVLQQVLTMGSLISERKGNLISVMTFDEYVEMYGLQKKVVKINNADASQMATLLQPHASKDKGRIVGDPTSNSVVLLLPEPLMSSVLALIKELDIALTKDEVRIVKVQHIEAQVLVPELQSFLVGGGSGSRGSMFSQDKRLSTGSDQTQTAGQGWLVHFMVEPKLNIILLRGLPSDVKRTEELIGQLDVAADLSVRGYQLKYTNTSEVYDTLRELVDADLQGSGSGRSTSGTGGGLVRLRIAAAEQNNRIIVEGSPRDHSRISKLIEAIDQPLPPGTGGTRVYRLENAEAGEVVGVLQDVIEDRQGQDALAKRETTSTSSSASTSSSGTGSTSARADAIAGDVLEAKIVAAEEINAVVIRASASEHEEFSQIIADLDQPREQVLLEFTLVTVRSEDTFRFGLQFGGSAGISGSSLLGFSSFGLATVDPLTGGLAFPQEPLTGLNLGLFNVDDFSLVLNALKTVGDVRVSSSPKLLVQDNAEGEISQINQEPYQQQSQSNSTTLSSFGGFVDAGTTMNVTPHISRDGWLRLDYQIDLSSFGTRNAAQAAANLPPPRRESTSQGTIRVPEDHIVVVGGLVATREDSAVDSVPLLGDIPLLGELFKSRTTSHTNETLYIFIRPVVLRDPAFADLLMISARQVAEAGAASDEPVNELKLLTQLPGEGVKP
jgi:general secretion pathway protein D